MTLPPTFHNIFTSVKLFSTTMQISLEFDVETSAELRYMVEDVQPSKVAADKKAADDKKATDEKKAADEKKADEKTKEKGKKLT